MIRTHLSNMITFKIPLDPLKTVFVFIFATCSVSVFSCLFFICSFFCTLLLNWCNLCLCVYYFLFACPLSFCICCLNKLSFQGQWQETQQTRMQCTYKTGFIFMVTFFSSCSTLKHKTTFWKQEKKKLCQSQKLWLNTINHYKMMPKCLCTIWSI